MTDADDVGSTRPISVAELLAKNGTIGAPPAGGRRRRRRGNSDAVTVAELTGEIPIITDHAETSHRVTAHPPVRERIADPEPDLQPDVPVEPELELDTPSEPHSEGDAPPATDAATATDTADPEPAAHVEPDAEADVDAVDAPDAAESVATDAEADYAAHLAQRDVQPDPIDFAPPPRRSSPSTKGLAAATGFDATAGGAEQMSPDPVVDDDDDLAPDLDFNDVLDKHAGAEEGAAPSQGMPSYLRSGADTLFGGQSVADDLARRGLQPGPEDIDLGDDAARPVTAVAPAEAPDREGSAVVRGIWVVAQCVLAVAFGAGLFVAFDQLWRWNTIVALVLSVLVILGLVVGVRVVRKTEDIGSTLIAVAVGALVTLGPLALLQSH